MDIIQKKEVVSTLVRQAGLSGQKARVILGIDRSVSIQDLYDNGTMQAVVENAGAIALELDDDGQLEVLVFSDNVQAIAEPLTKDNYVGYVNRNVSDIDYGGTSYAPLINAVIAKTGATQSKVITYMKAAKKGGFFGFGSKDTSKETRETVFIHPGGKTSIPTLLLMVTDGDNDDSDKNSALQAFITSSKHPIAIACLLVNGKPKPDFKFLKGVDTMPGRFLDNVSTAEVDADKLKNMDVPTFMKSILGEFLTSYIPAAKKQFLIK